MRDEVEDDPGTSPDRGEQQDGTGRTVLPRAQRADGTCRLLRVVERDGIRLEVWGCSSPAPRKAPWEYTPGVFRRGPEDFPAYLWPGGHDAWSCNSERWPGHIDLVLYLGGPEEAAKTEAARREHMARQERSRIQAEADRAARELRLSRGHLSTWERMAEGAKVRKEAARAADAAQDEARTALGRQKTGAEHEAEFWREQKSQAVRKSKTLLRLLVRLAGRRSLVARIGRFRRRIFLVTPEEAARIGAKIDRPGWYITTVRSPDPTFDYSPLGPFGTVEELLEQAGTYFLWDGA